MIRTIASAPATQRSSITHCNTRTCALLLGLLFVWPSTALALFQGTEIEDRNWSIDENYFMEIASFTARPLWDDYWQRTQSGYRLMTGSITNDDLWTLEQLRWTVPLDDHFIVRLDYLQTQSFDEQFRRFDLTAVVPVSPHWAGIILGEVVSEKEFADAGFGLQRVGADPRNYIQAKVRSVNNWYTEKNLLDAEVVDTPYDRLWNYQMEAGVALGGGAYGWLQLEAEPDIAIRFPDSALRFEQHFYTATVGASGTAGPLDGRPLLWRASYTFEDTEREFITDDPLSPALRTLDRQLHWARLDLEWHRQAGWGPPPRPTVPDYMLNPTTHRSFPGPRPRDLPIALDPALPERTVRAGLWLVHFDEALEHPNAPDTNLITDHRDAILHVGYIHGLSPYLSINSTLYAGGVRFFRQRGDIDYQRAMEWKLGLGLEFRYAPRARVMLNLTQDLDDWVFGGGNVRALFLF